MDNGNQYEQHEMILTQKYPSGAKEFYCPTCGRRFVMQWPPVYKRIVLDPGDENAIHANGESGIIMNVSSETANAEYSENEVNDRTGQKDDPYLSLWEKYIDNNIDL